MKGFGGKMEMVEKHSISYWKVSVWQDGHFDSSLPSKQSLCPSHCALLSMHKPLLHWNSCSAQGTIKKSDQVLKFRFRLDGQFYLERYKKGLRRKELLEERRIVRHFQMEVRECQRNMVQRETRDFGALREPHQPSWILSQSLSSVSSIQSITPSQTSECGMHLVWSHEKFVQISLSTRFDWWRFECPTFGWWCVSMM